MKSHNNWYHHGNLREALIRAAIAQAAEDGLETLTIRRVADRTGVTPGAAYHHFASKQHLLVAAAEVAFAELLSTMRMRQSDIDDPVEQLVALGRGYIEHCIAQPAHFRIMVGRHMRELEHLSELAPSGRRCLDLLSETSERCSASIGRAIPAVQLARATWAQLVGVVSLIVEREIAADPTADDVRELVDTAMAILRGGILAAR
ncbi:MAG TPA: TetR/AcrR family transcriptional regulator [Kofleriaceae bacterium]|nr:TetR/AcrR family transcriptional regulator [Kofleriaceae bacterium]